MNLLLSASWHIPLLQERYKTSLKSVCTTTLVFETTAYAWDRAICMATSARQGDEEEASKRFRLTRLPYGCRKDILRHPASSE